MSNTSLAILIVGTIINCLFTWMLSIKARRPHGIPRFFSFESILLLTLFNVSAWFEKPLAWNQFLLWILLALSIFFAILGFLLLLTAGKSKGDFENTSKLVTVGLYRFIRHPMYSSLLFLGTGVFLKDISMITGFIAFINAIAIVATAKREEREMAEKFGDEYLAYMKKTRMFIPFVI